MQRTTLVDIAGITTLVPYNLATSLQHVKKSEWVAMNWLKDEVQV